MSWTSVEDVRIVRDSMAGFDISPSVSPNEPIEADRVFFPDGHRAVFDFGRQLVVGNRGMGKSFWTHALIDAKVRARLAETHSIRSLPTTDVVIGFNGSLKQSKITPTVDEIKEALESRFDPELIWRAAVLRSVDAAQRGLPVPSFSEVLSALTRDPAMYAAQLSAADDILISAEKSVLVVFDALDRLSHTWDPIRDLTTGLLRTVLGLQSFRRIRAKVFMRVDQFDDSRQFAFPDSAKLKNDRVELSWKADELFALLLFELIRDKTVDAVLDRWTQTLQLPFVLPRNGRLTPNIGGQKALVEALAGKYMGRGAKKGNVYSWVPLHLSDANGTCSPRTFLTAWMAAAAHHPAPERLVVDHLGLNEGVRKASETRMAELREDYPWIELALQPLNRQFVPITQSELFKHWNDSGVIQKVLDPGPVNAQKSLPPNAMTANPSPDALLAAMRSVAVMEVRANGKVNVPDIFRVKAGILRKGGVAVPRRN